MLIIDKALGVLKTKEFIAMATADKSGKPHSAPKFLLKIEGGIIYFIDYSIGKTAENLKVNPDVSLSFIDVNSLVGYILNGKVEIIEKGKTYSDCVKEMADKEIKLSVERVVKGVRDGQPYKEFELEIPERFLLYKVKIFECCEISPRGEIQRESG